MKNKTLDNGKGTPTPLAHGYDVSYLPANAPPVTNGQILRHYLCSALLYGAVLLLFTVTPWFRHLLEIPCHKVKAIQMYYALYGLYLVLAPVVFFLWRPKSLWLSKNVLLTGYLGRLFRGAFARSQATPERFWQPTYGERQALAFFLIKTFYGPLMVNSALLEYNVLPKLAQLIYHNPSFISICDKGYLLFISLVFLLDSVLFIIGYHTEAGFLNNRLRYAETNVLRLMVCLMCYAPFNMATAALLGPSNQDVYITFQHSPTHPLTWVMRGAAILALLLLSWASLSLLTKASNLTNRGIVQHGPYRYIRHPGYLGKNLFWIITCLPVFIPDTAAPAFTWASHLRICALLLWGIAGWGTIYFLRCLAEEAFLNRDPDYVEYCKQVKYRFIPGVY